MFWYYVNNICTPIKNLSDMTSCEHSFLSGGGLNGFLVKLTTYLFFVSFFHLTNSCIPYSICVDQSVAAVCQCHLRDETAFAKSKILCNTSLEKAT